MGIIFGAIIGVAVATSFFGVFADPIFQILITDGSQLAAHLYLNGVGVLLGWMAWIVALFCSGTAVVACFFWDDDYYYYNEATGIIGGIAGGIVGGIVGVIGGGIVGGIVGGIGGGIGGVIVGGIVAGIVGGVGAGIGGVIVGMIVGWIGNVIGGWIGGGISGVISAGIGGAFVGVIVGVISAGIGGWIIGVIGGGIVGVIIGGIAIGVILIVSKIIPNAKNLRAAAISSIVVCLLGAGAIHVVRNPPLSPIEIAEQNIRNLEVTNIAVMRLITATAEQAARDAQVTALQKREANLYATQTALWLQARSPDAPTATGVASPGTPTIAPTPTETPTVMVTPSVTPTSALIASQTAVVHQRETLQARLTQLAPDNGTGSSNSSAGSDSLTLFVNILRDPVFQGLSFIVAVIGTVVAVIAAIIAYLDYRNRRKHS